jgi:hypothetical protein
MVQICTALDMQLLAVHDDAGETLAVLNVHILQVGAQRQLRPGRQVYKVFADPGAGCGSVITRHASYDGGGAVEFRHGYMTPVI